MESLWKERKAYPLLGFLSIAVFFYLNFCDDLAFPILWQPKMMGFVGTNSTQFVINDDNREQSVFYVNGWNSYWLMEVSVWSTSRSKVSEMFRRGSLMGMTVCRTWAFSDGDRHDALQIAPGVFNEMVFQGLDFVIAEAKKHQIRLILCLVNNLDAFGGKDQYVKWAQEAGVDVSSSTDSFFSHPTIKRYYKNYIRAILTRKNSLTGLRYSEEPAVFAWELINEPRCTSSSSAPFLQTWITEMAAFIKSLDQNHLVTVGLEGFYGSQTTERSGVNPGEWAASLGTDFIQNSAIEYIDFASVHAYPESWITDADLEEKARFLSRWVDYHINDAERVLKKPVLFTEVGSSLHTNNQGTNDRDFLLKITYDKVYESAKKKQAGAGVLIWQLMVEGVESYNDEFSLVAWEHPSTYKLILEHSCRLRIMFEKGETNKEVNHADPCFGS
ncbi:mannan endo-1,4-beta-mannosidase 6-like [Macadamia integrifolia]|uniref:mannan endo-1,4-beta-mannosidase 6-like n=1 Tax=Macadamia integrifolia TaxID=60698 RepID=UPI001C5279AF|nr:mannan endo-1,4-beta-mannosidase 6-like [Macadamia integrifolia]